MKRKLLLLLLIPVLLLGITACGSKSDDKQKDTKKEIVLQDTNLGFKTTFTYKEGEGYSDVEVDKDTGASTQIEFDNEKLDLDFQMYYNTMRISSYRTSQNNRSGQKYYKEYKFNNYEAYAYSEYDSKVYLNILLKVEEDDTADVLFISIDRIDDNKDIIVADVVAGKKVQKLLNTIKFEQKK